jgi:ribulose-phosphate 3-epimerase
MKIHPALLVKNLSELLLQISNLTSVTKDFDIDIIDWQRTPEKTLSLSDALNVKGELNLHFDLMLDNPQESVQLLIKDSRVKTIILSLDCLDDISLLIDTIHHHGKRAGLSINPNRKLFEIAPYINDVELIQIFTIEPGSQGQPFLPARLLLCQELKELGYKNEIEIDGGVNLTTIDGIKEFPIDILSIGSALSKAADPAGTYTKLLEKIKTLD